VGDPAEIWHEEKALTRESSPERKDKRLRRGQGKKKRADVSFSFLARPVDGTKVGNSQS